MGGCIYFVLFACFLASLLVIFPVNGTPLDGNAGKVCHATANLRIVVPDLSFDFISGMSDPTRIQQMWACDDGSTFWRDVPVVKASEV